MHAFVHTCMYNMYDQDACMSDRKSFRMCCVESWYLFIYLKLLSLCSTLTRNIHVCAHMCVYARCNAYGMILFLNSCQGHVRVAFDCLFIQFVNGDKHAFVEFFAPCEFLWICTNIMCTLCKTYQRPLLPFLPSANFFSSSLSLFVHPSLPPSLSAGCGHCKRLAPAYEEVGKAYDNSDEVIITKVDCDAEKALAKRFGVTGYPTLKFFPKGSTEPEA